MTGDAKLGACVACDSADLTNCGITAPVCSASYACTTCTTNTNCARFAKDPVCDQVAGHSTLGQCVECATNTDCPSGTGGTAACAGTRLCGCTNNAAGNTYCNSHWSGTSCVSSRCQ
jgi:hypothetical protein